MRPNTIITLSTLLLGAATAAAAVPHLPNAVPDEDAHKAAIFAKLTAVPGFAPDDPCVRQAWAERKAARGAVQADFIHDLANCVNVGDPDEQWECVLEAFDALDEGLEEVEEQFLARRDLCMLLGGGTYEPEIDPEGFSSTIDNPYWPQLPGVTYVYEKETDEEEVEVIHVSLTDMTREILGVECAAVRDTVWVDGEIAEDTLDYYAQDGDGNVWYFGELSFEYEDGEISGLEGSWIAGEDGAHPGVLMWANPTVGQTYRQEFLLGEAEDAGTVLSLNETVDVPYGEFDACAQTLDFTPLEPGHEEWKFFAPGVGLVLEVDPDSGERLELVDIVTD